MIRESGVGFFGSKYIAGQLRAMNSPYYFYSVENASHVIATAPMDGNRDAIDAFLSKLVVDKEPLMIETDETTIGAPEVRKNFTLAEYIASNSCKRMRKCVLTVRIGLDLCRLDNDAMCPMSMLGDGSATDCCREYSVWSFRCCSDCG